MSFLFILSVDSGDVNIVWAKSYSLKLHWSHLDFTTHSLNGISHHFLFLTTLTNFFFFINYSNCFKSFYNRILICLHYCKLSSKRFCLLIYLFSIYAFNIWRNIGKFKVRVQSLTSPNHSMCPSPNHSMWN